MDTKAITSRADAATPTKTAKLRSACDNCHQAKVRCSGGTICTRCREFGTTCVYSTSARTGKPKGSRSRKTIEREQRAAALALMEREAEVSTISSSVLSGKQEAVASLQTLSDTRSSSDSTPAATSSITMESEDAWTFGTNGTLFKPAGTEMILDRGDSIQTAACPVTSGGFENMSWTVDDLLLGSTTNTTTIDQDVSMESSLFWDTTGHLWASPPFGSCSNVSTDDSISVNTYCESSLHLDLPAQHKLPLDTLPRERCQCLAAMAALVPSFTSLIGAKANERIDLFLMLISKTSTICHTYQACQECPKDVPGVGLLTNVLGLIVWLVDRLFGQKHGNKVDLRLQLGTFEVSDDDLQKTLICELVTCGLRKLVRQASSVRSLIQEKSYDARQAFREHSPLHSDKPDASGAELIHLDHRLAQLQSCFPRCRQLQATEGALME